MQRYFLLCLLSVIVALARPVSSPALAQTDEWPPLRFVAIIDEGIVFFERTETGTLEPLIEPLDNFAVESYGGSAEWMILSHKSFAVSPDGQQIAVTAQRNNEAALFIYTINDDRLIQRPIVSHWLLPVWSPDSEAVLLRSGFPYRGEPPVPEAYVYHPDTDQLVQVTHTTTHSEAIFQWTADSQSIVYSGGCETPPYNDRRYVNFYFVSRDSGSCSPLTDFASQLPDDVVLFVCFPTWSPSDQRWYYAVGCGTYLNTVSEFAYSVDMKGDNRLEVDLEAYLQATDGPGVLLHVASLSDIHARSEGVYLSVQLEYFPDPDLHPELPVALISEWRVLRLSGHNQIETVYRQPTSTIRHGATGLTESVLSPDGRHMAMLYNFDSAFVIDIANNRNIGEVHGLKMRGGGAVCDVRWLDHNTVVYNVGGHTCGGADLTKPRAARLLNVMTGKVTTLTEGLDGPAWVLPIPEAEVLAQISSGSGQE